jgi:hypothetical protein
VKIAAALAAGLGLLTEALDEPGADVADSLRELMIDATAAILTFLGLSVTVDDSDPPFTFTTFVDGVGTSEIRTSLRLPLPGVVVVLYAGSPGTFVDLAADLAWLTARPLSDFVLDQHLQPSAERFSATELFEFSVVNQAIGALIGRGHTPEQAERHLTAEAADAGISLHAVGLRILAGLDAR